MPINATSPPGSKPGNLPTTVAPSTRVTVALPFSTIKIHEPDERIHLLAGIVAELAEHLAALDAGNAAQELRERARNLANELAT